MKLLIKKAIALTIHFYLPELDPVAINICVSLSVDFVHYSLKKIAKNKK